MIDLTQSKTFPKNTTMPDLAEFMTTQEAAESLELTIRAVNRLVVSKKLEGVRVGRMNLISRVSVNSYVRKTKDMNKYDPRRKTITK